MAEVTPLDYEEGVRLQLDLQYTQVTFSAKPGTTEFEPQSIFRG